MRDRLTQYINGLFAGAPDTPRNRELQEELLQNNLEKFDDLVREGTPEAAAFNLVVGELGDVTVLMDQIRNNSREPIPQQDPVPQPWRTTIRGILLAVAVMCFILSVLPPILMGGSAGMETLAVALMFILIATGVGLIIFRAKGLPVTSEGQKELEASREAAKDPLFGAISGLLWVIILAAYFIVSFKTGAWYITWLAFPIGGAVEGLVKAIFDLTRGNKHE